MVKIITDSTSDLSADLLERFNIDVLPLHILLGDEEFEDGKTITPERIYEWADENKTTPKTSAPSEVFAKELFEKNLEKYDELIVFTISFSMSTSGNVCRLAAEELEAEDKIHVVDSKNLSTGIGLLVVKAAELAKEGKNAKEILEVIDSLIPNVRASFVVDTLEYLHRGGRCSGLAAMMGTVLKLHPKIVVKDGAMLPEKKYRGAIDNVIMNYAKDMESEIKSAYKDRVFITHSGCDAKVVNSVKDYLKSLNIFDEIHETRAGGVVSSHCGPGTLGVLYIMK